MKLSTLKASHLLTLAALTVSIFGVNGLICKASLAEGLNQNGQSMYSADTISQSSLTSEKNDFIYAKVVKQNNLDSLNSSVSIPESSPSIIPFLAVGALLFTYKNQR